MLKVALFASLLIQLSIFETIWMGPTQFPLKRFNARLKRERLVIYRFLIKCSNFSSNSFKANRKQTHNSCQKKSTLKAKFCDIMTSASPDLKISLISAGL